MIKRLIQITINLTVGALILASPVAYSTGLCAGSSCCCAPESTDGLSLTRSSCCPCGEIVPADKPVQEAVIDAKITVSPVRPELDAIELEFQFTNFDNNFLKSNQKISIHSPPGDIALLFAPLLC